MSSSGRILTGADILDGSITAADLAAGAVSQSAISALFPSSTLTILPGSIGAWIDLAGSDTALAGVTSGAVLLTLFQIQARHTVAAGRFSFRLVDVSTGTPLGPATIAQGHAVASNDLIHVGVGYVTAPASGALTVRAQVNMVDSGTGTLFTTSTLWLVELRR